MKKLAMIVFAGVVLLACNKRLAISDPQENVNEPGTYIFTLKASVADDLTKTSYADEKTFSWSANDEISVVFHKVGEVEGDDIIFVDLKTTEGGTPADFSGTVPNGYEIGASAAEGGVKWALFPAGAHSWNFTNHKPNFNIPEVTDFTLVGAHFSANIPMCAKGDGENNFTFSHVAGAYKFTFTDVDATKVRFKVTHNTTHNLSGNYPISESDGRWWPQYASAGSANQSVSYINNVASKTASFYFCITELDESSFQPTITLYDENTGYILFQSTAKSVWSTDALKPDKSRMVILPSIPAPGTGSPFVSMYGVNWGTVTATASGSTESEKDAIIEIKASADASYLYLYFTIDATKMHSNVSYKYSNHWDWFFGDNSSASSTVWTTKRTTHVEGWIKKRNVITMTEWNDNLESNFTQVGDVIYVEQKVKRSAYTCLQGTTCNVGLLVTEQALDEEEKTVVDANQIGYAPVNEGPMLAVTMPTYVAP